MERPRPRQRPRVITLEAATFLRRFLLHVLPHRFVRIRHYGWLANSARERLLPRVREVLGLHLDNRAQVLAYAGRMSSQSGVMPS